MRATLLGLYFVGLAAGQELQFAAASIPPVASSGAEGNGRERVDVNPTSVSLRNASLGFAIQWAYDVPFYLVSGPEWLKETRYDMQATPSGPSSERDLRRMLRAMLSERFKLVLHSEQRQRPVYSLVVRGTPRLQSAGAEAASFAVSNGDFVFRATSMKEFAERLSDFASVDRPVIDNTGLAGTFHFRLESAARAIRGGDGPSIFTAVSEIGLQLRPVNQEIQVLVVDSASRVPSEN